MISKNRRAATALHALALGCALAMSGTAVAECPAVIQDESRADVVANPPGYDYDVYFTTDAGSHQFSVQSANNVRDALVNSHNTVTDATRAFQPPFFSEDPTDTCISNSDNIATAPEWGFTVDAPQMNGQAEPFIRAVMGHEMFHHVEYSYIDFDEWPAWGTWTIEATARAMEDKMWLDTDNTPGNSLYFGEVNDYLGNPNRTLMDISYTAALFWTYLMEQLGTPFPEPARGVDVIERFWNTAQGNDPDSVQYLRDAISSFDSDATLEDMFLDFAITNYTHDLDVSALPDPSRWSYFDETAAGGGTVYDSVPRTNVASFNTTLTDNVVRWGAKYFEVQVPKEQLCEAIGFWGKARDGKKLGWALVGMKAGGKVTEIYRSTGNEFYRALINPVTDEYDTLALVVTGLNSSATFDYAFGFGPATGEIRLPTVNRMAYVGQKNDPQRFQLRLLMEGPDVLTPDGSGDISVRGLDPTLFEVKLRSAATSATYDATILNATYVSGEYWMVIQAPEITNAADGDLYDVEICFCKRSGSCTAVIKSTDSVLYADITLNQALVLDQSFSMHYPVGDAKIDAAKNAASIYVNAASDKSRLSLVSFEGDDSECNDDAKTHVNLVEVAPNRGTLLTAIDGIIEDGWTSIGDGIKHGRDTLFAANSTTDIRSIVLMSDGLENEGDFWGSGNPACGTPAVKDSFDPNLGGPAADMQIDTIALGADADQALLQSISAFTNGYFYAVSTDAPNEAANVTAGGAITVTSASLEVPNRLANVYRTINENLRGHDRLYSSSTRLSGGGATDVIVPVTEKEGGGIRGAVFSVNWDVPHGSVGVTLRDPFGNVINPGAGWQVTGTKTDKVYQYDGVLPAGDWTVSLSAPTSEQFLVMLSGTIVHGVDLETYLSAVPAFVPRQCEARFQPQHLRGLPVSIFASLTDSKGGLENAFVEARIENPDGSVNMLVLHDDGNHDDGAAGDGLYGNAYTRTPFASTNGVPDFPAGPPIGIWGSYNVEVFATGKSNFEETYTRTQLRSFHVYEFPPTPCNPDVDADGMADRWEILYGLDPNDPADAGDDNDNDGLRNKDEFYYGGHPFDADTDDGGESDGSEVAAGRDPVYQLDDALPAIVDYGVVTQRIDLPVHEPQPKTNILHFPVNPSYEAMQIWRTDPTWSGFKRVERVDLSQDASGVYYDKGLETTFTYSYYLVAEGQSGATTPPTDVFKGTPKEDPLPPKGWVKIENGKVATPTTNVMVQLDIGTDTKEYLLSERADFQGAVWKPIVPEVAMTLTAEPTPFVATVYARFRDAAGNESVTYHDTIVVDPNADNDADGVPDTSDNCTAVANPDQNDSNNDGYGNACDPDLNNDGIVNFADLGLFKSVFFSNDADADFTSDGVVNFLDLAVLKQMFLLPPGPSGTAP